MNGRGSSELCAKGIPLGQFCGSAVVGYPVRDNLSVERRIDKYEISRQEISR